RPRRTMSNGWAMARPARHPNRRSIRADAWAPPARKSACRLTAYIRSGRCLTEPKPRAGLVGILGQHSGAKRPVKRLRADGPLVFFGHKDRMDPSRAQAVMFAQLLEALACF